MFIAGEGFNPLSYRGTPLEPLLPIELSDARNPTAVGNALNAFRPELTAEGRTNPIFRFGDDEAASAQIWRKLPELLWYIEAPRKKPAALVLAEHPTRPAADGKLPIVLYQFVGVGQGRCSTPWTTPGGGDSASATATSAGSGSRRSGSWRARSCMGQKQAEIPTDRRRYQRNQPIQIRVRFPNPAGAGRGRGRVQVERKGQGPRELTLKASPSAREHVRGGPVAGRRG